VKTFANTCDIYDIGPIIDVGGRGDILSHIAIVIFLS
jgi:hypothetical protein